MSYDQTSIPYIYKTDELSNELHLLLLVPHDHVPPEDIRLVDADGNGVVFHLSGVDISHLDEAARDASRQIASAQEQYYLDKMREPGA